MKFRRGATLQEWSEKSKRKHVPYFTSLQRRKESPKHHEERDADKRRGGNLNAVAHLKMTACMILRLPLSFSTLSSSEAFRLLLNQVVFAESQDVTRGSGITAKLQKEWSFRRGNQISLALSLVVPALAALNNSHPSNIDG